MVQFGVSGSGMRTFQVYGKQYFMASDDVRSY